jgi:hypothetical protein
MVIVGVGGASEASAAPPARTDSGEVKRKLGSDGSSEAHSAGDDERDSAEEAKAMPPPEAQGDPKRARSGGAASEARQPLSANAQHNDASPVSAENTVRTKEIAAKVAAKQQEAATRRAAGTRILGGLGFGRRAAADEAPEPTPVAGRTRTRGAKK